MMNRGMTAILMSCFLLVGCAEEEENVISSETNLVSGVEESDFQNLEGVTYKYQIVVDFLDSDKVKETTRIFSDRLDNYFEQYEISVSEDIIFVTVPEEYASEEIADALCERGSICFVRQTDDQNKDNYEFSYDLDTGESGYQIVNSEILTAIQSGDFEACEEIVMTGKEIDTAVLDTLPDMNGEIMYVVNLQFTKEGSRIFEELTKKASESGESIAILYNETIVSAPYVTSVITGGQAVIQGSFSKEEATKITNFLNSGVLPYELNRIQ